MKKHLFIMLAVGVALMCSSCVSQTAAIDQLRALTTDVQVNGANYTINDWKDVAKKYGKVEKRISKHRADYTAAQLQEIGTLRGQMLSGMATGIATQAKGHVGEITSTLSTIFEQMEHKSGAVESWKDLLKPFVEKLKEQEQ